MIARWLFLILLVLNLVLFVWGYTQPKPFRKASESLPVGIPQIKLLSESTVLGQPKGDTETKSAENMKTEHDGPDVEEKTAAGYLSADPHNGDGTVPANAPAESRCILLGPFDNQPDAFELITQLEKSAHKAETHKDVKHMRNGFWVLIPSGEIPSDVMLKKLADSGMTDIWRFSKGEFEGDVSLGLYSDKTSAEQRVGELEEMGFEAAIHPRNLDEAVYWVRTVYFKGDLTASAALEEVYNKYPNFAFPPPECNSIATFDGIE